MHFLGLGGIATAFWLWMVIECMRRGDRDWVFVVVFLGPLGGLAYFIVNVLPGVRIVSITGRSTRRKRRIQELEAMRHLGLTPAQTLELADLYFDAGRLTEAQTHYQLALDSAPDLEAARLKLAKCYVAADRMAEAHPVLEPLLKRQGYYREQASLISAEALRRTGQPAKAAELLQPIYHPSISAEIQVQYAECLRDAGRKEDSRAVLEKLIPLAPLAAKADRPWFAKARQLLKAT